MREVETHMEQRELKELVVEASRALARLDADRLQELALSCRALNRELVAGGPANGQDLARQAREAAADMAVYARVLEATRANLHVLRRLNELRACRLEYSEPRAQGWTGTESGYGDN